MRVNRLFILIAIGVGRSGIEILYQDKFSSP